MHSVHYVLRYIFWSIKNTQCISNINIYLIVFHLYIQSHHLNNGFTKETDSSSQIMPKKTKLKIKIHRNILNKFICIRPILNICNEQLKVVVHTWPNI